jgi:hypothetical protein
MESVALWGECGEFSVPALTWLGAFWASHVTAGGSLEGRFDPSPALRMTKHRSPSMAATTRPTFNRSKSMTSSRLRSS